MIIIIPMWLSGFKEPTKSIKPKNPKEFIKQFEIIEKNKGIVEKNIEKDRREYYKQMGATDHRSLLKDLNVIMHDYPCFMFNWNTMKFENVEYREYCIQKITEREFNLPVAADSFQKDFIPTNAMGKMFNSFDNAFDFIKKNKHQIIVTQFYSENRYASSEYARTVVFFAQKPNSEIVT